MLNKEIVLLKCQNINQSILRRIFKDFNNIYISLSIESKRLLNKFLLIEIISDSERGKKSGEFEISIRADGKSKSNCPKTINPELLSSQLRGHWLRKHDTHSKHNRLELPIFIAKSTNGKLKLTIDREELPNYLNLSLKKCYQLTEGFYLPETKIINSPRVKIDYKNLASEYKRLINNGTVLNRAALARKLNVSRAWVTKVFRLG